MDYPGIGTLYCLKCGKEFARDENVYEHIQLCHGTIVNIVTAESDDSNASLPDHNQVEYSCISCNKKFETEHKLQEHTSLAHKTSALLAQCVACGVYDARKTPMQVGDKCIQCGTIFTAVGTAELFCLKCGKQFQNDEQLKEHKQICHDNDVNVVTDDKENNGKNPASLQSPEKKVLVENTNQLNINSNNQSL